MLRKLIGDDLRAVWRVYFPPAAAFFLLGLIAALVSGRLGTATNDLSRSAAYYAGYVRVGCQSALVLLLLYAVLWRTKSTLTGSSAAFWHMIPAPPRKHIVSKLICTVLLYIISDRAGSIIQLVFLRSEQSGLYAADIYSDISADPSAYLRSQLFLSLCLLLGLLCLQELLTAAELFTMRGRARPMLTFFISLSAIIIIAAAYAAGYEAIISIDIIADRENGRTLLGFSYSCAFFGIMTIVFTVISTRLLSRHTEL